MKRLACVLLVLSLMFQHGYMTTAYAATVGEFVPAPQTAYATEFVAKCAGQQWFIDEVERLLNTNQKTIDTLTGSGELGIITSLGFANQSIEGHIPTAIGELKELRSLFLSGNRLTGSIPAELFHLAKLEHIDLSGNQYSGGIPAGFGSMPALSTLMLRGNAFSGGIPAAILSNTRITTLDVSSNKLTGGFPAGITGMTSLQSFMVSDNPLGGVLPELTGLTELKGLSAWGCGLSGTIPDSLYTLSHLQILDLAGNSLTGQISPSIGGLTELQLLSLGGNELTGPIPAACSALTQLATLDLSSNKLEGVIPNAFGAMDKLMELHLEENKLRGPLPDSIDTRLTGGAKVYARDNYLTGAVLAKVADNARNFCDGANTEQYRMAGPASLTINESAKINVWPMVQNRNLKTGDTWLKPLLPIRCYTAVIENDTKTKVELTQDGNGFYVKVVPLPPPADPTEQPKKQELLTSENIRLTIRLTDNTGSEYSKVSILLTTEVQPPSGGGGGGGGGGSSSGDSAAVYETHKPYVSGYPDGRFGPDDSVTREQAAKLVVTALGAEVPDTSYSKFIDVAANRWSAPHIEYARAQGWLQGTGGGAFTPAAPMSRAEFATYLVRVWGTKGFDEGKAIDFPDVEEGMWYADYVRKASAIGLVQGMSDGKFHPNAPVSRAESVTIINRLLARNATKVPELTTMDCPFTDVNKSHWAYLNIMEASVEHQHIQTGGK